MAELLGVVLRGLLAALGHLVSALDLYELWAGRRRRGRLAALARGERVQIPCVLRDPELTGGRHQEGRLVVGHPPVTWRARDGKTSRVFAPGRLTLEAADDKALTFRARSVDGWTELRVHPDEAPHVLSALAGPQAP
jgi:hypothetical protein